MKRTLFIIVVTACVAAIVGVDHTLARGFGGGGGGGFHGGGGFGGGGFGGGGFGGGYHGGGYGGGGYHGGDFGGGGYGGGFHGGGGFHDYGGGYYGGGYHGYSGGAGEFHSGGFNYSGLGGEGYRGHAGDFGDLSAGAGAFRGGQFGSSAAGRGFDSFGGMRAEAAPSASRLNSFLGLPTDMGMHQASSEHAFGYTGSARGLSGYNPAAAAGERGAAGREFEGPNGTTIAHGSAAERGAAVGPNGAAAGGREASGTVVKGPNGNVYARGETASRGVVAGPKGVAGGARVASGTAVRGPEGNVAARGREVTRNWSAGDLRVQGNYARHNFHDYHAFGHGWYHDHPNAWYAAGFAAGFWAGCDWSNITNWFGVDWPSYGYMYGNDLTYIDNNVCLYGQPIATAAEYYDSAAALAQTGEQANIPNTPPPQDDSQPAATDPADAQWLPLGVFEAIPAGQKSSNMMFQLAVNKAGIIRGNFYDSADKNVQQIQGSVDKATQRVAWVVANKKNMIFDCGLYNLTKPETPVLVHDGKDKNEQWTLVRMQQKSDDANTQ
jgi:hypothetical protein